MDMRMRQFLVLGALTLTAGCSSDDGGTALTQQGAAQVTPASVAVPTDSYRAGDIWQQALLRGTLTATKEAGQDCMVMTEPDGKVVPVLWPAGYSARFTEPAELLGPDGKVVARAGDTLDLTGGWGSPPEGGTCQLGAESGFAVGPLKVVRSS